MPSIRSSGAARCTESRFSIPILAALAAVVAVALLSAVGAAASPSVSDKRAQAQAILEQVRALDDEVGDVAERWNGANYELDLIEHSLAEARADLGRARIGVKTTQSRIAERLRELYIDGEPASAIEVVLGARSLNEIVDVLDATNRIAEQDTSIAKELADFRRRSATRTAQLAEDEAKQAAVVRQRAIEKREIEAKLAERERLLASVQDEVRRLEAEERARQAELQRRARAELAQQQAAAAAARVAASEAALTTLERETEEPSLPAAPLPEAPVFAPPPADASKGAQVVSIAMQYLGINYVWGAASPSVGFDCSGLTMYVFNQVGVSLPHYAAAQFGLGVAVSKEQLEPGDLVFFRGLGHMGMYIGAGNFIHAPRTGDVVKISSLSESYYVSNWVGARRVL